MRINAHHAAQFTAFIGALLGADRFKIVGWVQPIKRSVFVDNQFSGEQMIRLIKIIPRAITQKDDGLHPSYAS
jgi:hypothetical protein